MNPRPLALAAALVTSAFALPASAGERTPLSALPVLPAVKDATTPPPKLGVTGIKVEQKETKYAKYVEFVAAKAQGYCIAEYGEGFASMTLMETYAGENPEELWHFTEAEGKATLERIRIGAALDNVWLKSRTRVELRAVASDQGATVWGFKETDGTIVLLARGAETGREAMRGGPKDENSSSEFTSSSSCTFGATRIRSSAIAGGAVAALSLELPTDGDAKKRTDLVVNISATKLSRDPESMLSVRIRKLER